MYCNSYQHGIKPEEHEDPTTCFIIENKLIFFYYDHHHYIMVNIEDAWKKSESESCKECRKLLTNMLMFGQCIYFNI